MGKVKFTVTVDDKDYDCFREIKGKIKLTQTVSVPGFGFEEDKEEYGNKLPYQDIRLMEHNAKWIARSIIREAKNTA